MAADKPASKSEKANVNLSTADCALAQYVAVTTEGESAGAEQLFIVYRRTQLYFGDRYRLIGYIVDYMLIGNFNDLESVKDIQRSFFIL